MSFFQFYNPDWSHLSLATPHAEDGWELPDHVPLALLLDLTRVQTRRAGGLSVDDLRLSLRRRHALFASGITTIRQLLDCTLSTLLGLPLVDSDSVMEIFVQLLLLTRPKVTPTRDVRDAPEQNTGILEPVISFVRPNRPFTPYVLVSLEDLEPLTLRHEWESFSGLPTCGASLLLSQVVLSDETFCRLRELGITHLHDLLDQSVADLRGQLGDETVEEVLDALTAHAAEVRLLPHPCELLDGVRADNRMSVLADRWGPRPITELNLASEAVRALRRAKVATVSELLTVLEPLHVELALDPFAFSIIWMRLQAVGLREEAWEDAGERLSAESYTRTSLDHVIANWRGSMSALRWNIVSARLGLEKQRICNRDSKRPLTLEEVANRYDVTRERVRQIETSFIERLAKTHEDYFVALRNTLRMILFQVGGVISLDQAADDLAEWINPGEGVPENFCRLILNNSSLFVSLKKNAIYALTSQPFHCYHSIIEAAHEIETANYAEASVPDLAEAVLRQQFSPTGDPEVDNRLPSHEFVAACLVATGGFGQGFTAPTEVALVRLLRESGCPLHFNDLTDRLSEKGWNKKPRAANYVHNHLLYRRDLFVYVSPGTYGLAEWGMEDRRVERGGEPIGNLMVKFLEVRGIPASKEEIMAHVLAQKNCRGGSVMQRLLYDERFHRFDKDRYGLSKWTF